jgi:hypothetical protein
MMRLGLIGFYAIYWLLIAGWVLNLVKLALAMGSPVTGLFLFRCVGVVVWPLGSVLGFL